MFRRKWIQLWNRTFCHGAVLSFIRSKLLQRLSGFADVWAWSQVENLMRVKNKVEKERAQLHLELDDVSSQLEEATKMKVI